MLANGDYGPGFDSRRRLKLQFLQHLPWKLGNSSLTISIFSCTVGKTSFFLLLPLEFLSKAVQN